MSISTGIVGFGLQAVANLGSRDGLSVDEAIARVREDAYVTGEEEAAIRRAYDLLREEGVDEYPLQPGTTGRLVRRAINERP